MPSTGCCRTNSRAFEPVAQFDVFANPGRQRDAVPYVVALQNSRYDRAATRLVAALAARTRIYADAAGLLSLLPARIDASEGMLFLLDEPKTGLSP